MTTADCLTAIATALNVLGRFDEARDMALEAREFDPGSIFAYEFLSSQDKAPDAPEWLAQFDKALRVNPGDDRLYALRARVQLASGDTEAGFMSLEKAIRIAPMDRDHRVLALDWLMKHERWPELEAQCSAAMKLAGEDAEFLAARAYARAKLGAFAPMLEDIALVEKCAPDDANQLYNCACALGVALSAAPDDAPGVRRKALVLLHQALTRGLNEPASIVVDVDLIPLRNDPEFQQLTRDFA